MKSNIYLETSIVSYLTARPSRDLIIAAHQQLTQEWWETRHHSFNLFVSQLVIQEISTGDKQAAYRRLKALKNIPLLKINKEALILAHDLINKGILPEKASEDALHIATATVHGMDYLLTWNCNHIANAEIRYTIEKECYLIGYETPVICTPEELMGG